MSPDDGIYMQFHGPFLEVVVELFNYEFRMIGSWFIIRGFSWSCVGLGIAWWRRRRRGARWLSSFVRYMYTNCLGHLYTMPRIRNWIRSWSQCGVQIFQRWNLFRQERIDSTCNRFPPAHRLFQSPMTLKWHIWPSRSWHIWIDMFYLRLVHPSARPCLETACSPRVDLTVAAVKVAANMFLLSKPESRFWYDSSPWSGVLVVRLPGVIMPPVQEGPFWDRAKWGRFFLNSGVLVYCWITDEYLRRILTMMLAFLWQFGGHLEFTSDGSRTFKWCHNDIHLSWKHTNGHQQHHATLRTNIFLTLNWATFMPRPLSPSLKLARNPST